MTLAILLSIEDIKTMGLDGQYQIITTEGMLIRFTEDAAERFIDDINNLKELRKEKRDK